MKSILHFAIFFLVPLFLGAQSFHEIPDLEIPRNTSNHQIIRHPGYTLQYNEKHEQADWVAYVLTREETNGIYKRTNDFESDPYIKTGSAIDGDYAGSGFDRGHLAPAADMGWSFESMQASFYYSNMSPQVPSFNRGIWSRAEAFTRNAAIENDSLFVVTGPVLRDDLPQIGPNKVSVPEYYYKVLLDYGLPEQKALAFLIPNQAGAFPLSNYTVSIDSIEALTGIDFFDKLPDSVESVLESEVNNDLWPFGSTPSRISSSNKIKNNGGAVTGYRCAAITKKGNPCKNKVKANGLRCWVHD
jgi:endonuclease G